MRDDAAESLRVELGTSSLYCDCGQFSFATIPDLTLNVWHHLVINVMSGTLEFFWDGNLVCTLVSTTQPSTNIMTLGNSLYRNLATSSPGAELGQVYTFGDALTPENVRYLFSNHI